MSMNSNSKILEENVLKVKGKILNTFLGIIKSDIPNLSIESFPERVNKKLSCLTLLKKYDLVWLDLQIEERVATLRINIFIGENLGQ